MAPRQAKPKSTTSTTNADSDSSTSDGPATQAQGQPDTSIAGFTPAMALANTTIATTHALATQAHNAEHAQVQSDIQLHTSTVQGLQSLLDNPYLPTAIPGTGHKA